MPSIPKEIPDRAILQGFQSLSSQEIAVKFPDAWRDYMEMYRACLSEQDKRNMSIEKGWFLYTMGYHQGRIDMAKFVREQKP